jgi:hypothetical protein
MGSRLIRVYRALVALALQAATAQSVFSLDAAFQILVTAQQPRVAPQLPTGGDVSLVNPMRSSAGFPLAVPRMPRPAHRDKTAIHGPQLLMAQGCSLRL